MPQTVPGNVRPNARCVGEQYSGGSLSEVGVSQTGVFSPNQHIMGEEHEAQRGENGIELAGTHRLDVKDMACLSKKRLNGGAFIVKHKQGRDGPVSQR